MTLKRRLNALGAQIFDPDSACCFTLSFQTLEPYHTRVWQRFSEGPMPEAPPDFLPFCTRNASPCPEARRHACAVWRNIARTEHLRNLSAEMFQ